jgi:hypothetical protein
MRECSRGCGAVRGGTQVPLTRGDVLARIPVDVLPLSDTEEVTGSNPVSPTMKALVSDPFAAVPPRLALRSVDLSAKLSA